jgi:hypothetical protein
MLNGPNEGRTVIAKVDRHALGPVVGGNSCTDQPVGNSDIHAREFSSERLPTQRRTHSGRQCRLLYSSQSSVNRSGNTRVQADGDATESHFG